MYTHANVRKKQTSSIYFVFIIEFSLVESAVFFFPFFICVICAINNTIRIFDLISGSKFYRYNRRLIKSIESMPTRNP